MSSTDKMDTIIAMIQTRYVNEDNRAQAIMNTRIQCQSILNNLVNITTIQKLSNTAVHKEEKKNTKQAASPVRPKATTYFQFLKEKQEILFPIAQKLALENGSVNKDGSTHVSRKYIVKAGSEEYKKMVPNKDCEEYKGLYERSIKHNAAKLYCKMNKIQFQDEKIEEYSNLYMTTVPENGATSKKRRRK